MTRFAADQVVRCPDCNKLVLRQQFASFFFTESFFPPSFQAIAQGDVICPHCKSAVDAHSLSMITRLDTSWKQGVWAGIPLLEPRISEYRYGYLDIENATCIYYAHPLKQSWHDRFFDKLREWAD